MSSPRYKFSLDTGNRRRRHVRKLQSCVAHAIPTTTFAAMPAYVTRRAEAARQQAPEIRNSETQTILARVYHFVFVPIVLIIL